MVNDQRRHLDGAEVEAAQPGPRLPRARIGRPEHARGQDDSGDPSIELGAKAGRGNASSTRADEKDGEARKALAEIGDHRLDVGEMLLAQTKLVAHAPSGALVGRNIDHGRDDATFHELTPNPHQEIALAELEVATFGAEADVAAAAREKDGDTLRLLGNPGQEIGLRHARSRGQRDDLLGTRRPRQPDRDHGEPQQEGRRPQNAAGASRPAESVHGPRLTESPDRPAPVPRAEWSARSPWRSSS